MSSRLFGSYKVSPVSLGCMNLSHAYATPPAKEDASRLLNEALDLGYTMMDTAALYGFGNNEELLREAIMHRRSEFVLASKCGMFKNDQGVREIDGRPEVLKKTCEDSLRRLGTDVIDMYYLHRWDKKVPIEDSVGALADLVADGKIKAIGLSEVSSETLKKAHAVHPISALQTEYSLWTRNAEISVLRTCIEMGVTFVAFSPVTRGFLCGLLNDPSELEAKDLRNHMPRFQGEHWEKNKALLGPYREIAKEVGCSMAQLALAWVLAQDESIIAIPGTTNIQHMKENFAAADIVLGEDILKRLNALINHKTVSGPRYNAATQAEVDTEEFA
ncbi:aldo/keto reductase [Terasakiella pusilla]|uniref:aldo/keto reductase n=1 Tax=Terasakiella pusilla TaxID=64973 RepID=UPI00048C3D31|nr:aldo/keto reductase [Terasakiella pusilla]